MPSDFAGLLPELSSTIEEAGEIAINARKTATRDLKPDGSILTNGDQLVERFLRDKLCRLVPDSCVWGEEFGFSEEGPGGLWLVDPVDGTSNYSFGSPLWGVSIALVKGRSVELGAVILPDLNELYTAASGCGAMCNGGSLAEIPAGRIKDHELVSFNDRVLRRYGVIGKGALPGKMRHSGAFVIDGCFVAKQRFRGLIGIRERLYDIAACVLFGLELGADVRYADGTPLELDELKKGDQIKKPWIIFPAYSQFILADS